MRSPRAPTPRETCERPPLRWALCPSGPPGFQRQRWGLWPHSPFLRGGRRLRWPCREGAQKAFEATTMSTRLVPGGRAPPPPRLQGSPADVETQTLREWLCACFPRHGGLSGPAGHSTRPSGSDSSLLQNPQAVGQEPVLRPRPWRFSHGRSGPGPGVWGPWGHPWRNADPGGGWNRELLKQDGGWEVQA